MSTQTIVSTKTLASGLRGSSCGGQGAQSLNECPMSPGSPLVFDTPTRQTPVVLEDSKDEARWTKRSDGSEGQGIRQPQQLTGSSSTSSATTAATSVSENPWDYSIPVPGSKTRKLIYPMAAVELAPWTREQWQQRFIIVKNQLESLVHRHLRLLNFASRPTYNSRMVGTCRSDARPSVVVVCRDVDFKDIQHLFRTRAQERLYLGKEKEATGLSKLFSLRNRGGGQGSSEPTVPRLQLVYYQTRTPTVLRSALYGPLQVQLTDNGAPCGGVIRYRDNLATLGVAVSFLGIPAFLTVSHLFDQSRTGNNKPLSSGDNEGLSSFKILSTPTSTKLDPDSLLWDDDDEYEDLDADNDSMQINPPVQLENQINADLPENGVMKGNRRDPELWESVADSGELDTSQPYLDWALARPSSQETRISSSFINTVIPDGKRVVLNAYHASPLNHLAAVYMVSGLRGIVYGQILAALSFLPSPCPGQQSGEAWTVILDGLDGIRSGECGSVVVDRATNKVYGHVVGSDPVGYAYVVPLANTLDQISLCVRSRTTGKEAESQVNFVIPPISVEQHCNLDETPLGGSAKTQPMVAETQPRMGDTNSPGEPEHLIAAEPFLQKYGSPSPAKAPYAVWAAEAHLRIGSRLYVACHDGGPPRMATAGPVFSYGGRLFQTTVRHVFFSQQEYAGPLAEPSLEADLNLDDSDSGDLSEAGDAAADLETGKLFRGQEEAGAPQDIPTEVIHPSTSLQYGKEDQLPSLGKGKELEIPTDAFYVGGALPTSVEGTLRAADVALIEVRASDTVDPNLVSYDPSDSSKKLRVTRPADMTRLLPETRVIVLTSSGPVYATLLTTLAYIKPRFQQHLTAVYPLLLDEDIVLSPGNCGSLVVLIKGDEGHMLGHVLFGHSNTAVAYILPINTIIEEMASVLISLIPGENITLQLGPSPQNTPVYCKRTEFGSPRFYKELGESVMPKTRRVRGIFGKFVDKLGYTRDLIRMSGEKPEEMLKVDLSSFETYFFEKLPPELRDQVINYLTFREAMNLRHVSTRFRAAVSMNGRAISKRFLINNPLPPLAQSLYPHPSPDLAHIVMVGHYHAVAWRLADHIVQWLRQEMFLYGSRFQEQQFQPKKVRMKQRLLPSLLLLGRFFQICHEFLEEGQRLVANDQSPITFEFEQPIISGCSNALLLQTQDVVLILVTFLRRAMRPPSQYGPFKRAFRYGTVKPPPDAKVAAVLYHGGLEVLVDILDIEAFDKRVAAVHEYCAPPTQPGQQSPLKPEKSSHGNLDTFGDSTGSATMTKNHTSSHLHQLLPRLPIMDTIWRPAALAVLTERGVVRGSRDLNSFAEALKELISESETQADVLYKAGHDLWHALSDSEQRHRLS